MSVTTIEDRPAVQVPAGKGFRQKTVPFSFATTSLTGTIKAGMSNVESVHITPAGGSPGLATSVDSMTPGTISASTTVRHVVKKAGSISAVKFVVGTTVATDAANIWTIGVINKGAAGSGTAVVVDIAAAANSNNSTGGTAFTANVERSLTVTAVAADAVVAAGDVLEFTFTKASSAANIVNPEINITYSTSGSDEVVYWNDTLNTTTGMYVVPSNGLLNVARTGTNPTSAQKYIATIRGY